MGYEKEAFSGIDLSFLFRKVSFPVSEKNPALIILISDPGIMISFRLGLKIFLNSLYFLVYSIILHGIRQQRNIRGTGLTKKCAV
jgi:hypothetical protein